MSRESGSHGLPGKSLVPSLEPRVPCTPTPYSPPHSRVLPPPPPPLLSAFPHFFLLCSSPACLLLLLGASPSRAARAKTNTAPTISSPTISSPRPRGPDRPCPLTGSGAGSRLGPATMVALCTWPPLGHGKHVRTALRGGLHGHLGHACPCLTLQRALLLAWANT